MDWGEGESLNPPLHQFPGRDRESRPIPEQYTLGQTTPLSFRRFLSAQDFIEARHSRNWAHNRGKWHFRIIDSNHSRPFIVF
jgi:hypothetical protein